MAAAVRVDDRMLPVAERGARVAEHPVVFVQLFVEVLVM